MGRTCEPVTTRSGVPLGAYSHSWEIAKVNVRICCLLCLRSPFGGGNEGVGETLRFFRLADRAPSGVAIVLLTVIEPSRSSTSVGGLSAGTDTHPRTSSSVNASTIPVTWAGGGTVASGDLRRRARLNNVHSKGSRNCWLTGTPCSRHSTFTLPTRPSQLCGRKCGTGALSGGQARARCSTGQRESSPGVRHRPSAAWGDPRQRSRVRRRGSASTVGPAAGRRRRLAGTQNRRRA
jgi:hypothetical protein